MSAIKTVRLGQLMATEKKSVDPRRFPEERFTLYSIPAHDSGYPEEVRGIEVGSAKVEVHGGDVLLSRIVPHIRRAWVVGQKNGHRLIASGEWIVFRGSRVDPRFLRAMLLTDAFHNRFMRTVSGVGGSLVRARPSVVADIEIPLPSLAEQQRIAAILDLGEALRAKRRASINNLEALKESTFIDMFGDPFLNPKGWPVRRLREIAQIERGKFTPRPRNNPDFYGGAFPFIQTGDLSESGGRIKSWRQTLNEKGTKVSRSFPPGTVVVAIVGATLGITAILDIEVYCPDSVIGIQADPLASCPDYLDRILRRWRPVFVAQAPETARANINLETFRPLEIPVPPVKLQRRFSEVCAEIDRQRLALERSLERMNALIASINHRVFCGAL